jgi:tRNA G18 (ribose-2'-O)-methylase SpoU
MSIQNSYQLFHNELKFHNIYEKLSRPIIISDNIKNPENMGSILRIAGNIGAAQSLFISDNSTLFKKHKINRTASGASEKTNWKIINKNELAHNIPNDYTVVALETTSDSENIYQFNFPEKTAIIIGNEVAGISDDVLKFATHKVYIPIPGPISSLNVTHALAIAMFEWWRQHAIYTNYNSKL